MPIIPSEYCAPPMFRNGHVSTIYPTLFRRVQLAPYYRTTLTLSDGDFLDLDWIAQGARQIAIISHGMEGSSQGIYVRGMARALNQHGWDVLAWNFRGCGGTPNNTKRFYHSGASDDLAAVIAHVVSLNRYEAITLIGFSMGANITLKYLGENADILHPSVRAAVVLSVPCDLEAAATRLAEWQNMIYMRRFLRFFKTRMQEKTRRFPSHYSVKGYHKIHNFRQFDDRYTAPIHGFRDAQDYWEKSSSKNYLSSIRVPTLIINAEDDPFLAQSCCPYDEASASPWLHLEVPTHGGHVGFVSFSKDKLYWSERRVLDFLSEWSHKQVITGYSGIEARQ